MDNSQSLKIFSTNFKHLRESRGLTTTQIAEKLNVSQSTISVWENGVKFPRAEVLDKITNFFNISLAELMSKDEIKDSSLITTIPLYGSVAAGALSRIPGKTANNIEYLPLPIKVLGKYVNDKDLFAMKVNGESMNKIIPDGSYVVAKSEDHFNDGDIVIFSHDGDYALKRYRPHAVSGAVLFKAETTNPKIKDIVIPYSDEAETRIYGKVILYSVTLP